MKKSLFYFSLPGHRAFLTTIILIGSLLVITATSIHAAEPSTEIDTLRRSIAALNEALQRHQSTDVTVNDPAGLREEFRFREHLQEQISLTCRKLFNLGGAEALADLNCPDERVLGTYLDKRKSQTGSEAVSQLEGTLLEALGDFDDMLLKEEERIERKKARSGNGTGTAGSTGGAGVAATGSGTGQQGGSSPASTEAEGSPSSSAEGSTQTGKGPTQTTAGSGSTGSRPGGKGGTSTSDPAAGAGGETTAGGGTEPMDTLDSRDDDIVARQLREAAEKETNPELKEKLWEEYRKYKGLDQKSVRGTDADETTP